MNPTEFKAYALSEIVTKNYDNFCDFILGKEMEINIGYAEYVLISLDEIIESINVLISCNEDSKIEAPFDVREILNMLFVFVESHNLEAENVLVYLEQ
jgi:hypothetical protein